MSGVFTAMAIAAAAGYVNNRNVARKQDNTLAASLRTQGELQKQANAKTGELIKKTADSTPDQAKSDLLGKFMAQIQQNQGNAQGGLNQVGNVSDAYAKDAANAASGISTYGGQQAGLLSSIDAPSVQRQAEAANDMRYGTAVNALKHQSDADEFLTKMRLQGIKANPWLTALGTMASAYAGSGGMGGAAAGGGGGYTGEGTGSVVDSGNGFRVNLPFKNG